jgi:hypothetical protein
MALDPKKIKVLIKSLEDLLEALNEDEPEEEEDPPPTKRAPVKRGKKVVEEEPEEEEPEEEPDDDAPTLNELRTLAVKASKKATDGKEKVLAALQKHGSERLTEIDEDNYADLKTMLDKIIDDDDYDPRAKQKKPAPPKRKAAKSDDF